MLAIEHEFIKDRSLTIAGLQLRLAIYAQMFPALTALMGEIIDKELIGGQLLDALHQSCTTGNPVIKNMFTRILFVCHKVFFHQINAWIVHGQLVDISQEFFIHKLQQNKDKGPGALGDVTKDDAKSELNKTTMSTMPGVSLFSSILMSTENFGDDDQSRDDEWNTLFSLRLSMLPSSYISASLAQKILFIGKAVKVLQSKRTPPEDRIPEDELQCFSEAIAKLQ